MHRTAITCDTPQPVTTAGRMPRPQRPGFTLIELLVVIAIIGLLMSILVPVLSAARHRARAVKCLSNLRGLGQGTAIYLNENYDVLMPSRLPKIDDCNAFAMIHGRVKYRPTFLAMMSTSIGVPPFDDPQPCKTDVDMFGEPGDRQNYSYAVYVCPSVAEWTDERNGSYGYNYHFLGNSRLFDDNDLSSYKNWPVSISRIRHPGRVVMAGDCMGTAAAYTPAERLPYGNNTRATDRFGDEGFNLDPPRLDPINGEVAGHSDGSRSAADPRHADKANIVWVDGHATPHTLEQLGYVHDPAGRIAHDGDNSQWTTNARDEPWTPEYRP